MNGYKPYNSEGIVCYCKKSNKYYIIDKKIFCNFYFCLECEKNCTIIYPLNSEVIHKSDLIIAIDTNISNIEFTDDDVIKIYTVIDFLQNFTEDEYQHIDLERIKFSKKVLNDILLKVCNTRNVNFLKSLNKELNK